MGVLAYIEVDFEPVLQLGEIGIRWQTVGVALALLVGVAMAARGRTGPRVPAGQRAAPPSSPYPAAPAARPRPQLVEAQPLRLDDLGYMLLASVPGAVIGGRLIHGLVYLDAYSAAPARLLDPAFGSLSLLGAVLGGSLAAALMCVLLGAPLRRWADAAAIPLLVTLGLGKLAQFLGGSGQGRPSSSPWAVSFRGDGPWVSSNPALPAHAAQVYEGLWLLLGVLFVASLAKPLRQRPSRVGGLFVVVLWVFLLGRLVVGFSWRNPSVVGALNAEQLLALAFLSALLLGLVAAVAGRSRYRGGVRNREGGA